MLPIDMEIVMIVSNLPSKLSELSKVDADKAIELMQAWSDGKKSVKTIWNDANNHLSKHAEQ
ncbi:hypothetical protein P9305_14320 [Lysinibacillus capsici]|uniref:hypothetical protein n=1 Tax=Lysinibacillus capsici TaxID=2115968 RepID=UPI002E1AE6A6|nr:hypothetical protein [Lysinibacillus capsici]